MCNKCVSEHKGCFLVYKYTCKWIDLNKHSLYRVLIVTLVDCLALSLSVVILKLGHAIAGLSLGLNNPRIIVWPSWQIYYEFNKSNQKS